MDREEQTIDLSQLQKSAGDEQVLLSAFRALNRHGRAKAIAYIAALAGLFPGGREQDVEPVRLRKEARQRPEPMPPQAEEAWLPEEPDFGGAGETDFVPVAAEAFPVVRLRAGEQREPKVQEGKLLSQKMAQKIAEDICEAYGAALLGLKRSEELVILDMLLPAHLKGDELFSSLCSSALDAAAEFFKYDDAGALSCFFKSPAEGEIRRTETMAKLLLSKPLVEKGFAAFKRKVAADYNELLSISDEYYIHPNLSGELKKLKR